MLLRIRREVPVLRYVLPHVVEVGGLKHALHAFFCNKIETNFDTCMYVLSHVLFLRIKREVPVSKNVLSHVVEVVGGDMGPEFAGVLARVPGAPVPLVVRVLERVRLLAQPQRVHETHVRVPICGNKKVLNLVLNRT